MKLVNIHYSTSMEGRSFEERSAERRGELFLSEYRAEVVRIDCCILTIPLFWIDVPSSSECVWLSSEFPRSEADY